MRIALAVEYDGSHYYGWQSQPGLRTVQDEIQKALSKVADESITVYCAGRTDTGVHASHQVIHFDTNKTRNIRSWIYGGNSNLPKDVCIKWCTEVTDDFHARFSALSRRYKYIIYNNPVRPALFRSGVTWQYRPLDHNLMAEASQYLIGEQDFTSFRSVECQSRTAMRNIHHVKVERKGDVVVIDIQANAFLHHMVRNIAGVLINIGSEKKPKEWLQDVLNAKDRKMGAETAPPYGLYLVGVEYPKELNFSEQFHNPFILEGHQ